VTIAIVTYDGWDEPFASLAQEAYERAVGPGVPVTVVRASDIPRSASGKFPMITSDARVVPGA
jgi:hypothetical protein